ncbi:MAG TPA: NUDIX hydrolase [Prolixibacteraceae bacterium]|nr:NUDIX hydrolase [Prolixibacteraceae bacterium]
MYKVFFNDSSIVIASEMKKSSNNNISDRIDFGSYSAVNQIIYDIEHADKSSEYLIYNPDIFQLWNYFRRRFVEIPAAGGLVRNDAGSFLFIKRLGVWDLPKGKIEKNETQASAAVREVEEECGFSGLQIVRQLESTFHIYRSPYLNYPDNLVLKETNWFLMNYSGNEIPVPQKDENIEEARWFALSEFDQVLANTYLSLRDFFSKTLSIV